MSNIDLVMDVLHCTTREAVEWIAERFPGIPRVKLQITTNRWGITKHIYRAYAPVAPRKTNRISMERFISSPGWRRMPRAAKVLAVTLLATIPRDTFWLATSYPELMRWSAIGNRRTLSRSLGELRAIGLIETSLTPTGAETSRGWPLSQTIIRLTWFSEAFQRFLACGYSLPPARAPHAQARATGISVALLPLGRTLPGTAGVRGMA